jgi:hypothetical protein
LPIELRKKFVAIAEPCGSLLVEIDMLELRKKFWGLGRTSRSGFEMHRLLGLFRRHALTRNFTHTARLLASAARADRPDQP